MLVVVVKIPSFQPWHKTTTKSTSSSASKLAIGAIDKGYNDVAELCRVFKPLNHHLDLKPWQQVL